MKSLMKLFWLVGVLGTISAEMPTQIEQIKSIVTIEDHPWVIKNETCLAATTDRSCRNISSCYSGLLVDLLTKIDEDLKNLDNCTIQESDSFGTVDKNAKPSKWSGLMGVVSQNQSDLALAVFSLGEEIANERKSVMDYSFPLINNQYQAKYFSLGYSKASKAKTQVDKMIQKLTNQRHVEQLLEKWFNEGKSLWSQDKSINPYTPSYICRMF